MRERSAYEVRLKALRIYKETGRFSHAVQRVYRSAVVHRDCTSPTDIQIKIFDNAITFFCNFSEVVLQESLLNQYTNGWHVPHGVVDNADQLSSMGIQARQVVSERFGKNKLCSQFCNFIIQ